MLLILLRNSAFFLVEMFFWYHFVKQTIFLKKKSFEFGRSFLKILCRIYVQPDLPRIGHLNRRVKKYFKTC